MPFRERLENRHSRPPPPVFPALGPWVSEQLWQVLTCLLTAAFLFAVVWWSHECRPHWFSEFGVLGAIPWVGVLKVTVLNGIQTLYSSGRSWAFGVPS